MPVQHVLNSHSTPAYQIMESCRAGLRSSIFVQHASCDLNYKLVLNSIYKQMTAYVWAISPYVYRDRRGLFGGSEPFNGEEGVVLRGSNPFV